jgi:hypothetical protein
MAESDGAAYVRQPEQMDEFWSEAEVWALRPYAIGC